MKPLAAKSMLRNAAVRGTETEANKIMLFVQTPTMHRLRSSTASTIVATDLAESAPHWMKGWIRHVTTSKWAAKLD